MQSLAGLMTGLYTIILQGSNLFLISIQLLIKTTTVVTNKDSDQPVHPHCKARVPVSPSLDNLEAVEGT